MTRNEEQKNALTKLYNHNGLDINTATNKEKIKILENASRYERTFFASSCDCSCDSIPNIEALILADLEDDFLAKEGLLRIKYI
ncbi:MAG: hypothetical protein E7036_02115 [Opitutales bacterium]|nr:hypothetical protein [Opitutales bacterium]